MEARERRGPLAAAVLDTAVMEVLQGAAGVPMGRMARRAAMGAEAAVAAALSSQRVEVSLMACGARAQAKLEQLGALAARAVGAAGVPINSLSATRIRAKRISVEQAAVTGMLAIITTAAIMCSISAQLHHVRPVRAQRVVDKCTIVERTMGRAIAGATATSQRTDARVTAKPGHAISTAAKRSIAAGRHTPSGTMPKSHTGTAASTRIHFHG